MARRRYLQGKRAEAASGTRRRIVEATLSLHDEQGIMGTSVRNIADRAGVAPATVLFHFARMDDLIQACGELSDQLAPMPTAAILIGARSSAELIRRMAQAMFEWWERLGGGFDHLRTDRRHLPRVDDWLREVDIGHRRLAEAALFGGDPSLADVLVAVTTPDAWRTLRDAGADPPRAAGRVARLIDQASMTRKGLH